MFYKLEKRKKSSNKIIKIVIIVLLVSLGFYIVMYYIKTNNVIDVRQNYSNSDEFRSLSVIAEQDDYVVQRIKEKFKNSNIDVYYPVTKYELLNKEVKNIVDVKISKFKENVKDDIKYTQLINFDVNKYNNYMGFVFHVLEDYTGAHPNTYIFTVNYDIKNNSIINIDTLISKNNNILNLMSKYTYNYLSNNDKIKKIDMPNMLINGTRPIKTNFEDFIFTKEGVSVFFEKYQIAPYAYDEFVVTIPYEEINLKISE